MIAISLGFDRQWSQSIINDLITIRSWLRQALRSVANIWAVAIVQRMSWKIIRTVCAVLCTELLNTVIRSVIRSVAMSELGPVASCLGVFAYFVLSAVTSRLRRHDVLRLSICCPSVKHHFAWRDLSGRISMKLATDVYHVSGFPEKVLRSKVKAK